MILGLSIGTEYYLALSALLFTIGAGGLLVRRNPLVMFMCIELMLNAANLAFISFGKEMGDLGGQLSVLFVLVVAAAEVVIGLAIVVAVMRRRPKACLAYSRTPFNWIHVTLTIWATTRRTSSWLAGHSNR